MTPEPDMPRLEESPGVDPIGDCLAGPSDEEQDEAIAEEFEEDDVVEEPSQVLFFQVFFVMKWNLKEVVDSSIHH